MEKQVFNPWEVSGEINYTKLIKEFGLSPLKELGIRLKDIPNWKFMIYFN